MGIENPQKVEKSSESVFERKKRLKEIAKVSEGDIERRKSARKEKNSKMLKQWYEEATLKRGNLTIDNIKTEEEARIFHETTMERLAIEDILKSRGE